MINFPEYALKCLETIEKNGFEAYFVGGCLRDSLLGKTAHDIDITTSATPEEVLKMFDKTIPTGIKHGTVTVIIDSNPIEVTTYRTDGCYVDSRHPENVCFVRDIESDLSRRDFTVNAMAYNPRRGLVDLYGGAEDLNNSIIRTVGDPYKRFSEDALRILRALRFSSTLNFEIEYNTFTAAINLADSLGNISGERIFSELKKLAGGYRPESLYDLINCGGLESFGIRSISAEKYVLNAITRITLDDGLKLACMVALSEHKTEILKAKIRPDSRFINALRFLDDNGTFKIGANKESLKLFMHRVGSDYTDLLIEFLSLTDLSYAVSLKSLKQEVERNSEPYRVSDLAINGDILKSHRIHGKELGELLEKATLFVIEHPEKNNIKDIFDFIGI